MSSQAQGEGAEAPRRRGLGRYVQRMRTVLRTGNRHSRESAEPTATGSSSQPQATSSSQLPTSNPRPTPAVTTQTPKTEEPVKKPGVTTVSRAELEKERARKIAEKYGLTLEPNEWAISNPTAERIEKPIRMRIHRTCHKCGTTYGSSKICVHCEHARCTKCPRYPVKKDKTQAEQGKAAATAATTVGVVDAPEIKKLVLTRPSRTGGQPLVRKKPKQRVRRTCHTCGTLFLVGNKTCAACGHIRCVECPRDPPKTHLYPDGYPGDAPAPDTIPPENLKHPTRFKCHGCNTIFPRSSSICPSCNHEKCEQCPRAPPRKLQHREYDADLIRRVEEKLAALTMNTARSGPGA